MAIEAVRDALDDLTARQPEVNELLARVVEQRAALFGSAEARVELIARQARRYSDVLQLKVARGQEQSFAYLKVNRCAPGLAAQLRRALEADFEQQRRAWKAMQGAGALAVARPIAIFPEALAVVTEGARGETLDAIARQSALAGWLGRDGAAVQAFRRVGSWLAAFHQATGASGRVEVAQIRAYVDARLRRAVEAGRRFGLEERRACLDRFDALASRLTHRDLDAAPIHGDFSLENVLVDGEAVTAIDFDIAAGTAGTRYHDAAYLFMCLERLKAKPWVSSHAVIRLQRAVLEGLEPGLTPHRPLFQLMLLQHMACHLVEALDANLDPLRAAYAWYLWRPCRGWLGT